MLKRASGILLPVSSLPGPWGIGTLGEEARRFVDFLAAAGQTYWQILPVGPTGYGDSPYQSFSAFAANPYFIDPGILIRQGLLTEEEAEADWGENEARVDYGALYASRHTLLQKAADRLPEGDEDFAAWKKEQSAWLEDYALFMALKEENDQQSWYHWPDEVRLRRPDALAKARQRLAGRVDYWQKIQYLFYRQWDELLAYAHARLDRCPFGEGKKTCRRCPVHCYKRDMRERMRQVMRYAGPRMIGVHPVAALRHLWRELRSR